MNGPYKIGTLARLTGFSPALLRAWEKRFGLISPERGDGRQRVYGNDDLAVLRRVRTLVDQGRPIGEIAAQGRDRLLTDPEGDMGDPARQSPARGSGALCTRIVGGALALDAHQLDIGLDEAFATLGAERTIADVIVPAEIQIGELWEAGRCSVASEHMASSRFLHRLGRLVESAQPAAESAPRVMAACFPDEHHQLGLLVVAWHLARHGVRVEYLGPALPLEDAANACRSAGPRALLLSVTRREAFDRHRRALVRLLSSAPERVYVGGQGVPRTARPGGRGRIVWVHDPAAADVAKRISADLRRPSGRSRQTATR